MESHFQDKDDSREPLTFIQGRASGKWCDWIMEKIQRLYMASSLVCYFILGVCWSRLQH